MGSLFSKSKKAPSRVTDHDRAVLQMKQQRDKLKQYQRRIELNLEKDRLLAKKCLNSGRRDRAMCLLRKKKYQESLLANADKQLENLEKLTADLEFAQVELQVVEGLKQGNAALKKVHAMLDIDEIEKIMDETREGVEKQAEIDSLLSDVLTQQDEDDVLAELDAMAADEEADKTPAISSMPEVPTDEPAPAQDDVVKEEAEEERVSPGSSATKEKPKRVLVEA